MAVADELRALGGTAPGQDRCRLAAMVAVLRESEGDGVAGELEEALADPTITTSAVNRWLSNRALSVGETSIRRHRAGDCCCQ